MKNFILCILLFSTCTLFGQVPDSLDVVLPWQYIFISDCEEIQGEGPVTDDDDLFISAPDIMIIEEPDGTCYKKLIFWEILDWNTSVVHEYFQIVRVKPNFPLICDQEINIDISELPYELDVADVISDFDDDANYSFSYSIVESAITIDENNIDDELFVYNFSDSTVCQVNLLGSDCEDSLVFDLPETGNIEFNGEAYILLTEDLLGLSVDYPCGDYSIDIDYSSSNIIVPLIYYWHIDNTIDVRVELTTESGLVYTKIQEVTISGIPPSPIPMFIEEKDFTAGEETTFEVWSEDIEGLISWQFRLNFENARILDLEEGSMFHDIPINIFNDDKTINCLWFPSNALPIDVEYNETWFTLTVIPEIDGSTFDIFTTTNDPWSGIGIEDGIFATEFPADFVFNIAPREILDNAVETPFEGVRIHSNIVDDNIELVIPPSMEKNVSVSIIAQNGQLISSCQRNDYDAGSTIDVSEYSSGLYFVVLEYNGHKKSLRFIKK